MFYLSLITGFGLGINQTRLTLHGKCLPTLVGLGIMLIVNSVYRSEMGL